MAPLRARGRKESRAVARTDRSPVRSGQKRTRSTRLVQIVWRDHFGHLGDFTSNPDGGFTGDIDTLVIRLKTAPIRPVADKPSDKRPGFRITCGKADLKWPGPRRKDKQVYPSVRIDAPSFGQAINAALVEIEGVLTLVWPRSGGPLED